MKTRRKLNILIGSDDGITTNRPTGASTRKSKLKSRKYLISQRILIEKSHTCTTLIFLFISQMFFCIQTSGKNIDLGTYTIWPSISISLFTGDNQIGTINSDLPLDLKAIVKDGFGNPVEGVVVDFKITSYPLGATGQKITVTANGNFSPENYIKTDSIGIASAKLTIGDKGGDYTVTASINKTLSPVNPSNKAAEVSLTDRSDSWSYDFKATTCGFFTDIDNDGIDDCKDPCLTVTNDTNCCIATSAGRILEAAGGFGTGCVVQDLGGINTGICMLDSKCSGVPDNCITDLNVQTESPKFYNKKTKSCSYAPEIEFTNPTNNSDVCPNTTFTLKAKVTSGNENVTKVKFEETQLPAELGIDAKLDDSNYELSYKIAEYGKYHIAAFPYVGAYSRNSDAIDLNVVGGKLTETHNEQDQMNCINPNFPNGFRRIFTIYLNSNINMNGRTLNNTTNLSWDGCGLVRDPRQWEPDAPVDENGTFTDNVQLCYVNITATCNSIVHTSINSSGCHIGDFWVIHRLFVDASGINIYQPQIVFTEPATEP